jgi:hypothetical protein
MLFQQHLIIRPLNLYSIESNQEPEHGHRLKSKMTKSGLDRKKSQ